MTHGGYQAATFISPILHHNSLSLTLGFLFFFFFLSKEKVKVKAGLENPKREKEGSGDE